MSENNSKIKFLLISLLPIIILSIIVFYKIKDNVSIIDLQKVKTTFVNKEEIKKDENTYNQSYSNALEIKGDENFKKYVTQALKLIWLYDREAFYFVRKNIFEIRNENRTTFYFDDKKTIIAISKENAEQSPTWLAGIIIHNAWHAYYELNKKNKKATDVPLPGEENIFLKNKIPNPLERENKTLNDLFELEEKASRLQLKILQEIGAPQSELKKIINRKKEDFSVSHDGDYIVNP